MYLTERQKAVLKNLNRVIYRRKTTGLRGYFLDKEECTSTVNTLITKGLVKTGDDLGRLSWTELRPRQM